MRILKSLIKISIGIFIIAFLIYKIGIDKLYYTIYGIKLVYIPLLLLTLFIEFFLGALTLKILINCFNKKMPFLKVFKYFIRSLSLGLFVPAKLGEVSFVYFLSKDGIDIGKASAIFVLDKLMTFTTLSIIAIVGIFVLFDETQSIMILIFLLLLFVIICYFIISNSGRGLIKKYILKKYANVFTGFSRAFFYLIKNKTHIVLFNFFLCFIRWAIGSASVYIMFLAFNYNPHFFNVFLIKPLTIIASLIPITIAGLGVREGAAVVLFSIVGVPAHITATVYFVFTGINYILAGSVNLYYLYRK